MDTFSQFAAFATTYPVAILSAPICLLVFYWFLALLGLFEVDADFDLDFDSGFLSYAGLSQVPLALGLTIWFVLAWIVLTTCVYYISPLLIMDRDSILMVAIEAAYVLTSLVVTMPITKWCSSKLAPLFKIKEGVKNNELVGSKGIVISTEITDKYGEVEVTTGEGFKMRISALTHINESFEKGDRVTVVDFNEENEQYIVTKSNF